MSKLSRTDLYNRTVTTLCEHVEAQRSKLTEHKLPPMAIIEKAIEGIVAKRGKRLLRKSCPSEDQNGLAYILFKIIQFHCGNGHLGGLFGVDTSCYCFASWASQQSFNPHPDRAGLTPIVELIRDAYNIEIMPEDNKNIDRSERVKYPADKANAKKINSELDTLALVLLAGQSNAMDAWQKAIYG